MFNCPTCESPMQRANTISNNPSEFWLECTRCNTLINRYKPQPHQFQFHSDPRLYRMNAGGYGSGKTLTSRQELYKHLLLTPNANVLIGAKITAQYEQTIKRDIENDLPATLIRYVNTQKSYIDLVNGSRIMFRPFDDPEKLRSLNLSMFIIVEASETNGDTYHQLRTRLRNSAAFTPDYDWRSGIIETNPGAGWIRSDVLLNAASIQVHGSTHEQYPPSLTPDQDLSVHITSTDANRYLPPNFIQELTINKPQWWVQKYVYGSFQYAEGLVYPSAQKSIVEPFEIPKHWKRLIACDYGLADKFAYLAAALDPQGIVYIYKNDTTNNKSIEELSARYYDFTRDIPQGGMYTAPLLDPKSGAKRDYNKKTLYDHFLDYGIYFQPGHIQIDARVFRVNTYLESGKLKIFNTCTDLCEEIQNYKFPEKSLGTSHINADKPIDKDNHSINPLEWICMALPADPKRLTYGSFHPSSFRPDLPQDPTASMWQFSDNDRTLGDPAVDVFHLF